MFFCQHNKSRIHLYIFKFTTENRDETHKGNMKKYHMDHFGTSCLVSYHLISSWARPPKTCPTKYCIAAFYTDT